MEEPAIVTPGSDRDGVRREPLEIQRARATFICGPNSWYHSRCKHGQTNYLELNKK